MSGTFEINGKKLQPIKFAAEQTSYSRDYITRLAREQKIVASFIDRQWFIDIDSLKQYESAVEEERLVRQQQLSEERKRERQAMEVTLQSKRASTPKKRRPSISPRVGRAAVATAALGLLLIVVLQNAPLEKFNRQAASTPLVPATPSQAAMEPAKAESIIGEVLEFAPGSKEVMTIENFEQGMLLLPYATGTDEEVSAQKLFSDDITTMTDENGQSFVVRHNERGEVVEKIPYVIVPINSTSTP
jgi:hypothetical protein